MFKETRKLGKFLMILFWISLITWFIILIKLRSDNIFGSILWCIAFTCLFFMMFLRSMKEKLRNKKETKLSKIAMFVIVLVLVGLSVYFLIDGLRTNNIVVPSKYGGNHRINKFIAPTYFYAVVYMYVMFIMGFITMILPSKFYKWVLRS